MVHLSEIEHSDLVSNKHQVFAYVFNYMKRRKVSPWKVNGYWYGQPLTVDCFWEDGSSLKVRRMMLACYDRLLFPIEVERAGLIPYFSLLPTRKNYHLTNTTR